MDHEGEFWDELRNETLEKDEGVAARLGEINQRYSHDVYEKVPLDKCWESTGKNPVKVKWIDISKEDEINQEYRSRPVAKEIMVGRVRLDTGQSDQKQVRILNRNTTWTREGILHEADQRHVEAYSKDTGLEEEGRKDSTPTGSYQATKLPTCSHDELSWTI